MKRTAWKDNLRDQFAASEPVQRAWSYYQGLQARDQRALIVLSVMLGLLLLIFGVVVPLHESASEARERYRARLDDVAWMRAHRGQVPSGEAPDRPQGDSLLSLVNRSARSHGLVIQRFDPMGEGGVSLGFEQVEFDRAVAWLAELLRAGVRVDEFNATRSAEPGRVNLRVVLRG